MSTAGIREKRGGRERGESLPQREGGAGHTLSSVLVPLCSLGPEHLVALSVIKDL